MSERNNNFFVKKKEWSLTKDAILGCYLKPYLQKIYAIKKPICYVDCFAGKGKFDDGLNGSPLIALECMSKTITRTKHPNIINSYFIELYHGADLQHNIDKFVANGINENVKTTVISGRFEENIDKVLSMHAKDSLFLYVDPYGIKALDVDKFNGFKLTDDKSVEILLNFNTWGFFREACRVYGAQFELDSSINEYLVEYNPNENLSKNELSKIAGGDYWIKIIEDYKKGILSYIQAEMELSKGISKAFQRKYKYVLNVPIKSSDSSSIPKYRLYHLTNHQDGCILMAETMFKRISESQINNRGGQLNLFDLSTEGNIIDKDKIGVLLFKYIYKMNRHLNDLLCDFYMNEGIICSKSDIAQSLRQMELDGTILVSRNPSVTANTKRATTFMSEDYKHKFLLRRK